MDKKFLEQISKYEFEGIKEGDKVTLMNGRSFIAGTEAFYNSDADDPGWEIEDINGQNYSIEGIASPDKLKGDDTEYKTLNVFIRCKAHYNSTIRVPKNMNLDEALEYAESRLNEAPLSNLEYICNTDELDENNCKFAE